MQEEQFYQLARFLRALTNVAPNSLKRSDIGDRMYADLESLRLRSPAQAVKVLNATLDDSLHRATEWDEQVVRDIDAALEKAGETRLSTMLAKHLLAVGRLMRRKTLRNQREYDIVKSTVDDKFQELDPVERQHLEGLMQDFEARR